LARLAGLAGHHRPRADHRLERRAPAFPVDAFSSALAATDNPALSSQVLPLLGELQQEQRGLREQIVRLVAAQDVAFARQSKFLREEQRAMTARLTLQREQELETVLGTGRWLVLVAALRGRVPLPRGLVGWSLMRALQRLPSGASSFIGGDRTGRAGLPILPDAPLLQAIEQLSACCSWGSRTRPAANAVARQPVPQSRTTVNPRRFPVSVA
jgi:hypothetical protein